MTKRFKGTVQWFEGHFNQVDNAFIERVEIDRAILTDNIFNIEFSGNGDTTAGVIKLKSHNGVDFGGSVRYENERTFIGNISMAFADSKSQPCLVGIWKEYGYEYTCMVDLDPVEAFEDQLAGA